ncbi:MAG TPA: hypothetical protein VMW93_01155, partial [bacterium]|nr:hypothetical protein [bacterium]
RTFGYRGYVLFPFYGRQGIWAQSYHRFAEGRRRDVVVVDPRNAVRSEVTSTRAAPIFIRDPNAAEMWWFDFQREFLASTAARAVYYNTYESNVKVWGWQLEPYGLVYRVRRPGETDVAAPPWGRYEYEGLRSVGKLVGADHAPYDLTTYRLWANYYVTYGEYCFTRGRDGAGLRNLATAERAAAYDANLGLFIASTYNHYGYPGKAIPLFLEYLPALGSYRHDSRMFKREYAGFLNGLALAYLLTGDAESARRYYLESVELNPEQTELAAHISPEELAAAAAALRDTKR